MGRNKIDLSSIRFRERSRKSRRLSTLKFDKQTCNVFHHVFTFVPKIWLVRFKLEAIKLIKNLSRRCQKLSRMARLERVWLWVNTRIIFYFSKPVWLMVTWVLGALWIRSDIRAGAIFRIFETSQGYQISRYRDLSNTNLRRHWASELSEMNNKIILWLCLLAQLSWFSN